MNRDAGSLDWQGAAVNSIRFLEFGVDSANQCLWRRRDSGEEERVLLAPKAYALLDYLLKHAGRLVTHDELLEALWARSYVQPEVLKHHVLEIRKALEDDPKTPRYIETVPRRGYRFIAPLGATPALAPASDARPVEHHLVGRSAALAALHECLGRAGRGQMQLISVTGEPGIGKTALVDEFQRRAKNGAPGLRVALGQCVEVFGSQEGYYPMLEALGQLCRGPGGEAIVDILASQAPTWLVQFPALIKREHRETLQRELLGATRARMLREIGDALETITASQPLLLVLEDLQWVDHSTVDVLSALARRRAPAKLMLLATIRSLEAIPPDHPLKVLHQDLLMHGLCREISLGPLNRGEVAEYLTATAPECDLPDGLADLIHRNSGGNPLFMTVALDHLARRGLVTCESGVWRIAAPLKKIEADVPETLRQMIEARIERLSAEEQRALEVASVAGAVFSVQIAAMATDVDPDHFEDLCALLARRHRIIRPAESGQFPEGSNSSRYEFVHALYREVLYRRQAPRQRARLHRRIGESLENLLLPLQSRPDDVAAQLAHHFEQGMEWDKALRYTRLDSDVAVKRFSPKEALSILGLGLDLVGNLRPAERPAAELQFLERAAMIAAANYDPTALERYEALEAKAKEYGKPDVEQRALLGQVLPSSWTNLSRSEYLISRASELNRRQSDPVVRSIAQASSHFWRLWTLGWNDESAAIFGESGIVIEASADHRTLAWYRLENACVQFMASRYRESRRQVELGVSVLFDGSTDVSDLNLNLGLAYWGAYQVVRPWSAIHLGEWAAADREFEEAISVLERNRALYLANTVRLYRAWGWVIAHEFERARGACETIAPGWDSSGTIDPAFPPAFNPSAERPRLVTLGAAQAGLGQYDAALEHLEAARQQMLENPVALHWYWRVAVEWVLAQLWISRGDPDRAGCHAKDLLALTAGGGQATWRALALEVAAQIAMCERDLPRAREHITEALSMVDRFEIPVAAWRVQALAARFYESAGDGTSAKHHRELAQAATLRLESSLPPGHAFRKRI
jgi:DNA-binding winged helix-turn-helix (wHTH) protein/tetratricopeptide (TPR) repeat protein